MVTHIKKGLIVRGNPRPLPKADGALAIPNFGDTSPLVIPTPFDAENQIGCGDTHEEDGFYGVSHGIVNCTNASRGLSMSLSLSRDLTSLRKRDVLRMVL